MSEIRQKKCFYRNVNGRLKIDELEMLGMRKEKKKYT